MEDGLLGKLGKVFGKKSFPKGKGHRLGSSDDAKEQKAGSAASSSGRRAAEPAAPSGQARHRPDAFAGRPQRLGAAIPTQPQPQLQPQSQSAAPAASLIGSSSQGGAAQPTTATRPPDPEAEPAAEASEVVRAAVGQLQAGPEEPRSVLVRLLANIAGSPAEAKYRKIRLANPRIQAAVVDAEGGLELLQACGFQVEVVEADDGSPADAFAVLPEDEDLTQLQAALSLLGHRPAVATPMAAAAAAPAAPAAPNGAGPSAAARQPAASSEPCDRQTQVLLPSTPEGAADPVPDWVFKRTPAELKAAMLDARRKREQSEVLRTRAMREKLAGTKLAQPSRCTVRVRLPEGLLLQGAFNPDEPVAAVFDWVTGCLAEPGTTYALVLPDRKPLVTALGTLRSAQLLGNVLLMMRVTGHAAGQQQLTLKRELLLATRPA